eukprot:8966785-Pyramimonas_sp.AAC.1
MACGAASRHRVWVAGLRALGWPRRCEGALNARICFHGRPTDVPGSRANGALWRGSARCLKGAEAVAKRAEVRGVQR